MAQLMNPQLGNSKFLVKGISDLYATLSRSKTDIFEASRAKRDCSNLCRSTGVLISPAQRMGRCGSVSENDIAVQPFGKGIDHGKESSA